MAFRFQQSLSQHSTDEVARVIVRGASVSSSCADEEASMSSAGLSPHLAALNHSLYSLIRHNFKDRRSLLSGMLRLFDPIEQQGNEESALASLAELIFLADQLAHFPYSCMEEVLFLAHHTERRATLLGASIQRTFLDSMANSEGRETLDSLLERAEEEMLAANNTLITRLKRSKQSSQPQAWDLWPIAHNSWSRVLLESDSPPDEASWNASRTLETKISERLNALRPKSVRDSIRLTLFQQAPICLLLFCLHDYSPSDPVKQWDKALSNGIRKAEKSLMYLPELVRNTTLTLATSQSPSASKDRLAVRLCLAVRHFLMKTATLEHAVNGNSQTTVASSPKPGTPTKRNGLKAKERARVYSSASDSSVSSRSSRRKKKAHKKRAKLESLPEQRQKSPKKDPPSRSEPPVKKPTASRSLAPLPNMFTSQKHSASTANPSKKRSKLPISKNLTISSNVRTTVSCPDSMCQ
ncbi:hypothetical protein Ciccas_006889 [Cichlidogyrus casuarinus]|uniref:Nipped-B protein n=1 Tax=Cichlidogyrus casuarinus TaxID=1844966 RepID=A0ABD2Q501_9PLAT